MTNNYKHKRYLALIRDGPHWDISDEFDSLQEFKDWLSIGQAMTEFLLVELVNWRVAVVPSHNRETTLMEVEKDGSSD